MPRISAKPLLAMLAGAVLGTYLIVGRKTLGSVEILDVADLLFEARVWLVLLLLCTTAVAFRLTPQLPKIEWRGALPSLLAVLTLLLLLQSAIWSTSPTAGHKAYEVALILIPGLAVALLALLLPLKEFERGCWIAIWSLGGLLALLGIISVGGGTEGRLAVMGGGPNVFGRTMGLLLIAAVFHARSTRGLAVGIPVGVAALLLLLLSGSRGALLASALGVAVVVAGGRAGPLRTIAAGALLLAAGYLVLAYTGLGQAAYAMYEHRVVSLLLEQGYDSGRSDLFGTAITMATANPFSGAGLGAFEEVGPLAYPHNYFLELAAEGGFPALFLGASVVIGCFWQSWRYRGQGTLGWCAMFTLLFVFSQFSGDLFDSRGVFLIAVVVAFASVHARTAVKATGQMKQRRVSRSTYESPHASYVHPPVLQHSRSFGRHAVVRAGATHGYKRS